MQYKLILKSIIPVAFAVALAAGCGSESLDTFQGANSDVKSDNVNSGASDSIGDKAALSGQPGEQSAANSGLEIQKARSANNNPGNDVAAASNSTAIRILAWNVESGGNDPKIIAKQILEFGEYDIFALSEVAKKSLSIYSSLRENWKSIDGKNQSDDHLQIIYDSEKLEVVRWLPLMKHGDIVLDNGRYRSPLLVHFRHRESGQEFQVVHNHLARGKEQFRQQQANGLREWARDQTLPTIGIGDFNFDYVFATAQGNEAFRLFLQDNIWKWVLPEEMIDTNWYDPEGDGVDNYIGSMLDFAFVAGPAKEWNAKCNVIVRESDFPDSQSTSDHRPIELLLGF